MKRKSYIIVTVAVIIVLLMVFLLTRMEEKTFVLYYFGNNQGLVSVELPPTRRDPSLSLDVVCRKLDADVRVNASTGVPLLILCKGNALRGKCLFSEYFDGMPCVDLLTELKPDVFAPTNDESCEPAKLQSCFKKGSPVTDVIHGPGKVCVKRNLRGLNVAITACNSRDDIDLTQSGRLIDEDIDKALDSIQNTLGNVNADLFILVVDGEFMNNRFLSGCRRMGVDLVIPRDLWKGASPGRVIDVDGVKVAPVVSSGIYPYFKLKVKLQKGIIRRRVSIKVVKATPPNREKGKMSFIIPSRYKKPFFEKYPDDYYVALNRFVSLSDAGIEKYLLRSDVREDAGEMEENAPLFSLVSYILMLKTKADAAFINTGAVRHEPKGIIGIGDILKALPFENRVVAMGLKTRIIRKILIENRRYSTPYLAFFLSKDAIDRKDSVSVIVSEYVMNSQKSKYRFFKKGIHAGTFDFSVRDTLRDYIAKRRFLFRTLLKEEGFQSYSPLRKAIYFLQTGKPQYTLRILRGMEGARAMFLRAVAFSNLRNWPEARAELEKFLTATRGNKELTIPGRILLGLIAYHNKTEGPETAEMIWKGILEKEEDLLIFKEDLKKLVKEEKAVEKAPVWRCFKGDARRTGRCHYSVFEGKPATLWQFGTFHSIISSPVIDGQGLIYFGGGDGFLYCLLPDGRLKWKLKLGGFMASSPCIGEDGTVYIGVAEDSTRRRSELFSRRGFLCAVDKRGIVKWKFPTGGWVFSSPVEYKGILYFGCLDGYLYAVDRTGELQWKYRAHGKVFSSPSIDDKGNVYFGCRKGFVYCITHRGDLKWKYRTGGPIYSTPALGDDGKVYIGSDDRKIYALDPSGKLLWSFNSGGTLPASPSIGRDGTIYLPCDDGIFYALKNDGSVRWKIKSPGEFYSSPVIDRKGRIIFADMEGSFYCVSPQGIIIWKHNISRLTESSPAVSSKGIIYIGQEDNRFIAIGPERKGKERSKVDQLISSAAKRIGKKDYAAAIRLVDAAFKRRPDRSSAIGLHLLKADVYLGMSIQYEKDYHKRVRYARLARKEALKAKKMGGDKRFCLYRLIPAYNNAYEYDAAVTNVKKLVEMDPDFVFLSRRQRALFYLQVADAYNGAGLLHKAILYYDKAERLGKDLYRIYLDRAFIYMEMGDVENAKKNINKWAALKKPDSPGRPEEYSDQAFLYLLNGNHRKALEYINRAVADGGHNYLMDRVIIYHYIGEIEKSRIDFRGFLRQANKVEKREGLRYYENLKRNVRKPLNDRSSHAE